MRLRRPLALPAALLAAAAAAACASGCGSTAATLDPVAQAAVVTTKQNGSQMALTAKVSSPLGAITMTGSGEANFGAHEGQFELSVTGLPAAAQQALGGSSSLKINELFAGGALYMASPLFAGKLPDGAHWVKLDLARFSQALGLDPAAITSGGANPAQFLQYLTKVGAGSHVVGHEAVRGVQSTRYAASLDLLKAAEAEPGTNVKLAREAFSKLASEMGTTAIPVEAWVDGHGLLRKLAMTINVSAGGQTLSEVVQVEYFRFGPTTAVSVPGPHDVFDITGQALQGLSGAAG